MSDPRRSNSHHGSFKSFKSDGASPRTGEHGAPLYTAADHERALALMTEARMSEDGARSNDKFTYKEPTSVLTRIALGTLRGATPGLVSALLEYGADVNFERRRSTNLMKMIRGQNQEDVRSSLLANAVKNCSDDILDRLVGHADQTSLNQALPIAIRQENIFKVTILVARGADASPLHNEFMQVVEQGRPEMVALLTAQRNGACQLCRDRGLVRAVTIGHSAKAQTLLGKGANITFDGGAALKTAARKGNKNLQDMLASTAQRPAALDILDAIVLEAYEGQKLDMLSRVLESGARGPNTNSSLLHAISKKQRNIVDLMVKHRVTLDHDNGAPVVAAVNTRLPAMLECVLAGNPSQLSLASASKKAIKLDSTLLRYQMMDILLQKGLRGSAVDQALVETLESAGAEAGDEDSRLKMVTLLLKLGDADVNITSGQPLAIAASKGWIKILNKLIEYRPGVSSLTGVFEPALSKQPAATATRIFSAVLQERVVHPAVVNQVQDAAYIAAAKYLRLDLMRLPELSNRLQPVVISAFSAVMSTQSRCFEPEGLTVLQFLLVHGASGPIVSDAFCHSAKTGSQDAFGLLATSIDKSVLNLALASVTGQPGPWSSKDNKNLWITHSLLHWGAKGDVVDAALIKVVQLLVSGSTSESLVDTFLQVGSADVNAQQGEAVKLTVRHGNPRLLQKLTRRANTKTLNFALFEVLLVDQKEQVIMQLLDVVVRRLIAARANVANQRDRDGNTALFHAARRGFLGAVKLLLSREMAAEPNDGSLHEAARNLHVDVVKLLMASRHDVKVPSARPDHEGRNALQEVLYKCDGRRGVHDVSRVLDILTKGGSDPLASWQGRSGIFLAIENPHPVPVVEAFLNTSMRSLLNHERNVFVEKDPHTGEMMCMSATVYVDRRRPNLGDNATKLRELITAKGCVDRYHAHQQQERPSPPQMRQEPRPHIQPQVRRHSQPQHQAATGPPQVPGQGNSRLSRMDEIERRRRLQKPAGSHQDLGHPHQLQMRGTSSMANLRGSVGGPPPNTREGAPASRLQQRMSVQSQRVASSGF